MNIQIFFLFLTLIFAPLASFAAPLTPGSAPATTGDTSVVTSTTSSLYPNSINIPIYACVSRNGPGKAQPDPYSNTQALSTRTIVQIHVCLLNLPEVATITGLVAYRRGGIEMNENFYSSVELRSEKKGYDEYNSYNLVNFELKSTESQKAIYNQNVSAGPQHVQSPLNAKKERDNVFYLVIYDYIEDGSPEPAEPQPPSYPFSKDQSVVRMVTVYYR